MTRLLAELRIDSLLFKSLREKLFLSSGIFKESAKILTKYSLATPIEYV